MAWIGLSRLKELFKGRPWALLPVLDAVVKPGTEAAICNNEAHHLDGGRVERYLGP